MRRTYLSVVYTIFISTTLVVISLISLSLQTLPYIKIMVQQWYGSIFATCDCSGVTLLTQQPWFSALALLSLLTGGVVIGWLTYRFGYAYWQTQTLQNQLRGLISHTQSTPTYCYGVPIYQIDGATPIAVTIGFRSPTVYISRRLKQVLDPWEYWAVIKHELSHAVHRDPLHRFGLQMLRPVLQAAPKLLSHILALQELAADEAAHDDKALRSALLKLYEYDSTQSSVSHTVFGASYFSVTEARINRLLGQTSVGFTKRFTKRFIQRRIIILLVIVLGALTAANHTMARSDANKALTTCLEQQPMCQAVMKEVQNQWPHYYLPYYLPSHGLIDESIYEPIYEPMSIERTNAQVDWILIFD